ncbi:hypothetical protein [Leeuwenhoekiella sp. NPDC079379]|uniref:hypothetical protein n=1 Tax=Leeuwenhoekiella sp. NPDC079379 TaxID=3364122 RepID=UPI0037CB5D9C
MNFKVSKSISVILVILITAVLSYLAIQYLFLEKADVDHVLEEETIKINKQTPIKLDKETTLDSAVVSGEKSFNYYYTLIYKADAVNKDTVVKYVKPTIIARLKSNPEMDYFRNNDVIIYYHYLGYDGLPAVTLKITPDLYKN